MGRGQGESEGRRESLNFVALFFLPKLCWTFFQAAFDAEDENDILDTQSLLEKYREVEEKDGKDGMQWKRASGTSNKRNSWDSWLKYGVAAAAVGIGVCYSLIRQ